MGVDILEISAEELGNLLSRSTIINQTKSKNSLNTRFLLEGDTGKEFMSVDTGITPPILISTEENLLQVIETRK